MTDSNAPIAVKREPASGPGRASLWINPALALLSALLLVLIFPPVGLTWLAPIALTPILIACANEPSWTKRALFG